MFLTYTYRYKLLGALIIQTGLSMHAAIILQGNSLDQSISFTHPIKKYAMGNAGQFYVAAHEVGSHDFAIASAWPNGSKFFPMTPETVLLGTDESANNPLFDAQINHMTLMYGPTIVGHAGEQFDCIAAVKSSEPSAIYLVDPTLNKRLTVLVCQDLKDASGTDTTKSIVQMTSCNDFFIYTAVTDHNNDIFGQGNSGIAMVMRAPIKKGENQPTTFRLAQIDAYQTSTSDQGITHAAPLNNQSKALHIGNSTITILNNAIHLNWDANINCLYTALSINAQGNASQGGIAIVVGSFVPNVLILRSITFPDVFSAGVNNIVGGIGTDVNVSIHQTRPLLTTTVLNYLVILGGVGTPEQTKRNVYALPLVKRPDFNGMLAKKNAVPHTFYHKGLPARIAERGFTHLATQPGDLFTADDIAVQVGHGPMAEGDITTIFAHNDAVYAIVSTADLGHKPGIFHSQALFDNLGRIKEWTSWRRVSGNFFDNIFGASLNRQTGNITMLTGSSAETVNTVERTAWGTGDGNGLKDLVEWSNSIFSGDNGGIQGLYDIPISTPGLNHISLLIATGQNQIAIAQTGIEEGGIFIPLGGNELAHNPMNFTNGTIDQSLSNSTNAIAISGGALHELQIIKAATITRVNNAGYLFVGGINGLAVLINEQGFSFDASVGLSNNLAGLTAGSTFKYIGSYKFIRKLMCDDDNGFLYVVSDSTFDRIDIGASNFNEGTIAVTTLANLYTLPFGCHETILDAAVSRSLGIIATSIGLFRNGPQTDIRSTSSPEDVNWQRICLPEGLCAAKQIFSITQTGREQDLTTDSGGMIYILDTDHGKHQAMVHRFTINTQSKNPNYQYTIEELPDIFIKDIPSYFVQFAGYRTWISTDGALFFQERDKNRCDEPFFALLSSTVRSGLRFGGKQEEIIPIELQNTNIIQPIVCSSASGSWLLARNNILSVNE